MQITSTEVLNQLMLRSKDTSRINWVPELIDFLTEEENRDNVMKCHEVALLLKLGTF